MGTAIEPVTHTVLVIEDHEDTACLLRYDLERAGFAVIHVAEDDLAFVALDLECGEPVTQLR